MHNTKPFNAVTKRTEGEVTHLPTNNRYLFSKGAPQVIQQICNGGPELSEVTNANAKRGFRTLGVAVKLLVQNDTMVQDAPWEFVGYFALFDPPRVDSAKVLNVATNMGLHVKMITGDQQAIAEETMVRLGMGHKGRRGGGGLGQQGDCS